MYAVYEGIKKGNRFFSSYDGPEDCKLNDGTVAYKILHIAETAKECQDLLFGVNHNVYTLTKEQKSHIVLGLALLMAQTPDGREKMDIMSLQLQMTLD